jgi:putative inorganic carbon (hco3(-)) transporter
MLSRSDRQRALAMLGALILAPALLLDDVWHSSQLNFVHRHPLAAVLGAAVVLAILAGAAVVMHRRPWLVAPLTALTVPFRVPISVGGSSTNYLLIPLYFVVAASALGWLVPVLWRARAGAPPSGTAAEPRTARITLLFEQLLGAYVVLYALQALYSHGMGFPKALQDEAFFYVPFAILLARLRDIEWNRELLILSLKTTVALAVVFSLIGFEEEATKHLLISSKLVASNEVHEYFTVNSVFFDPNIFGRYLALVMLLLTAVVLYDRRTRVQVGAIVTLAVLWGCLVFTLSRSSLVALAVGLAVLAAFRWRTRPVLYLAATVAVAGAIVLAIGPSTFGLNEGLNNASDGRVNLISGGAKLFGDRWVLGWGSGSFSPEYSSHFAQEAASVSDSHNIPVTIGAEQGVVGELLYIALVVTALLLLFRGARGDPFRVAIAAAFLALVVHTMFYADFLEDPVTWTLLAVGGALVAAERTTAERARREERSRAIA